ncbi:40S ribosomal protein S21 [Datura stramonium]|uniref:40S ribosomal protein S21 n=1 Tax=Datura stramonium TaxID=4076 RepID=A0ABS8TFU5_DATST|nr:40S ribosomal protein S21 [Datura stramonium]
MRINMDLCILRKCSATNRLITSKDHASVQLNVGHLDESGRYTGQFTTYALCGLSRPGFSSFVASSADSRLAILSRHFTSAAASASKAGSGGQNLGWIKICLEVSKH